MMIWLMILTVLMSMVVYMGILMIDWKAVVWGIKHKATCVVPTFEEGY
jgi:hypothetical protein